ncbi:MAG: ThiF family adenylyltransferase, partial [Kiritimatiellae bacterium]|nr:ThiF family adenylyltransferase [Kiritimatiellia bacterium]
DVVAPSNVNRQCQATTATVGRPKVEALGERLRMINPACDVAADRGRFTGGDAGAFDGVDAAVDAIDSVDCKAELLILATAAGVPVVSSMGAALRTDPTRVRVTPFGEVEGDALAKALRRRFRRLGRFPSAEFPCVWSAEPALSREVRGSLMQVTATFGMCLAAAVVNILTKGEGKWKK